MIPSKDEILAILAQIPDGMGRNLVEADRIRALEVTPEGLVRFVIEVPEGADPAPLDLARKAAQEALQAKLGITQVQALLTAHSSKPSAPKAPPSLKIGRHPTPQAGPQAVSGIKNIIAIGSGKGGVGKSTVSSNLAVALARAGRKVGLLDADIYGPSQPRMMGETRKPLAREGAIMVPHQTHGVTMMSIGLMADPEKAIVWRGPMLMGALQQMLTQVAWGALDVLLIDLPPGTGDVQLSLCQKTQLTGALIVSTPQDVALIDARKAIDMFNTLKTPILGLIENMSSFCCPNCGHESHIFGHGGAAAEAERRGVPLLAQLPIDLETRLAGDAGRPVAAGEGAAAEQYQRLAQRLILGGIA